MTVVLNPEPDLTEDSEDLTDEEIASAIYTRDTTDIVRHIMEAQRPMGSPVRHEIRRRSLKLYWRATIMGDPDKVLLFHVDWLKPT